LCKIGEENSNLGGGVGTIRLSVRGESSWNRAVLHVFADSVSTIATNFPQVGTLCTGGLVESQASNPTSIRRGIASPSVRKAQRTRMPEARSALLGSYVPGSSLQAVPPLVRRSIHMEAFRISSQSRIRASAALEGGTISCVSRQEIALGTRPMAIREL
jgi:hypothetical protein